MIKKLFNKYFKSSPALRKMNATRKRIRSAYRVLIDNKVNKSRYETIFEMQLGKYELTPDELNDARKYGMFPRSYVVYDFDKWDKDQYLSERDMYKLNFSERGLAPFLVDKRNLPLLFQKNAHYLPSLNMAIDKGKIQYIIEDGVYQEGDFDLAELLQRCLKKYEKLIVKPNDASFGEGIFMISNTLTEESIQRIKKMGSAIINNVLINEAYAQRFNPSSLNTIRIIFFKTKNGTLKAIRMFHRFGASSDTFVDNTSGGGLAAIIDQETGQLIQAYILRGKRVDIDTHPVTERTITGFMIPDWDAKKRAIADLLNEINYLEYGGLDIAFTPEGIKIIEVNTRFPALRSMQLSSPVLIDDEFVEFLRLRGFDRPIPTINPSNLINET